MNLEPGSPANQTDGSTLLTESHLTVTTWRSSASATPPQPTHRSTLPLSLYKILFHFKALLWESINFLSPPPHLQSLPYCNTIA